MIRGSVSITAIKILDDVHTRSYLSEGSETLAVVIEPGIVAQVDKHLSGAGVRTSCLSKCNRALSIGLRCRIVLYVGVLPCLIDSRTSCQAELDHESRNDAKKLNSAEVAVLHKIVKTVCFIRSPRARDLHHEITLGSRECGFVNVRRFVLERCRMH